MFCWGVFAASFVASIALMAVVLTEHNPTALEVYQGKTTLEITYKDGVPIDSVVVFKCK